MFAISFYKSVNCFSAFIDYFRIGVITSVIFFHCILFHMGFYHWEANRFLPAIPFLDLSLQTEICVTT